MATFLELCRDLRLEAGIAGTGPATVLNQTGEAGRIVNWIRRSYNDIQLESSQWLWLRREFSFTMTPGKNAYTAAEAGIASRFDRWIPASVRIALAGDQDERMVDSITYDQYRSIYLTGPRVQSRPVAVSVTPDYKLAFGNSPDQSYRVVGEYQRTLQTLSNDSDVPEMPGQYHDAILYWALMKYARFESAPEVYQDAVANFNRLMSGLRMHQLPTVTEPEALA